MCLGGCPKILGGANAVRGAVRGAVGEKKKKGNRRDSNPPLSRFRQDFDKNRVSSSENVKFLVAAEEKNPKVQHLGKRNNEINGAVADVILTC